MSRHSSFAMGQSARFATTRWSLVLSAKDRPTADARTALADLCRAYWYPLYALLRRRCRDRHEAQDLTQEFFAKLLEQDFLKNIDPAKGRFRAFLLAAVEHFLCNHWDQQNAVKRGGGRRGVSLDLLPFDWESGESRFLTEPSHEITPERLFERQWALALLERVLDRLRDEYRGAQKQALFETLQPFLTVDQDSIRYADVAAELNTTEAAARVAAHRLRKRYRALLRDEIAQTVATKADIEDELRYLFVVLSSPHSK
ncbi:RNA polymerase sigma factor [Schlesneria sp. T3-172]|uniref:RNA polymerase sigma factor n=1 Tax=Schlesneria sphaerica TaxID=3373610 RepID=UPI0037C64792